MIGPFPLRHEPAFRKGSNGAGICEQRINRDAAPAARTAQMDRERSQGIGSQTPVTIGGSHDDVQTALVLAL